MLDTESSVIGSGDELEAVDTVIVDDSTFVVSTTTVEADGVSVIKEVDCGDSVEAPC